MSQESLTSNEEAPHWSDPAGALRALAGATGIYVGLSPLMRQAADEIDRLTKECGFLEQDMEANIRLRVRFIKQQKATIDRLMVALREIRDQSCGCDHGWGPCASCIAREALEQPK